MQSLLRSDLGEKVSHTLRSELLDHMAHVRLSEWERVKPGEIAQSMFEGAGSIGRVYIASQFTNLISNVILLLGNLLAMLALNGRLTLLALLAFPPSVFFTNRLKRSAKALADEFHEIAREGSGYVEEFVAGIRAIRAFNGEEHEKGRWRRWNDAYSEIRAKADLFHQLARSMPTEVVNNVALGLVFGFGAFEVIDGRLSLGSLVAFVAFVPRVYGSMRVILDTQIDAAQARAAVEKIDQLFQRDRERRGGRSPEPLSPNGAIIEFDHVSFDYGRGDFAVKDVSFRIEAGEFVGIVGASGGGKSTLFDLIMGFYEPQSGRINIDGVDAREWSLRSLRETIGYAPQDSFLWNRTLRDNLRYPENEINEEAFEEAVRSGGLSEWIESLPDRYETKVGANGSGISGGERQRIAISRVLMKRTRIFLLDEATSALDALTERKIRDSIERAKEGRTTVVIAHRLASVIRADRIIVLADGCLREVGTPRRLLANRGMFYELYQAQKLDLHLTQELSE